MTEPSPIAADDVSPRRAWALALLIAAAFFAVVAPTLTWTQFSNGNENIVTQTALEMRHGGPKLLPKLDGDPRVKKPPLVTWLTAASMRPATVEQLSDLKQRDAAYVDLAWQVRWPSLVAACVMILGTFEIGRVWGGGQVGLMSAMAVGTSYLFLKYMRQTTTDAHLAAWVAVTNACFVHGLIRGRWWLAATVGAVAAGLAFMCKGPVCLAETVVPTIVMGGLLRLSSSQLERKEGQKTRGFAQAVVGVLLFSLVALPWFIYVLCKQPHVMATWAAEVSREGATDLEPSNPLSYLELGPFTAPWIIFGSIGLLALWHRRRERAAWLPFVFAIVPLLVMVWAKDRKDRYLLPMMTPAAVICGYGVVVWMRSWTAKRTWGDVAIFIAHGGLLIAMAAALLIAGTTQKRFDGTPWYTHAFAIWAGVATAAFAGLTVILQRYHAWALPAATFAGMLALLVTFQYAYRDTEPGRSVLKPMADKILNEVPGAVVYDWCPRGRVDEQVPLYLNHTVLRADPHTLTPVDRPIVVISRQGKRDGPPALPPEWQLLMMQPEGPLKWFAYVRRP